jgi:hypothetical protein
MLLQKGTLLKRSSKRPRRWCELQHDESDRRTLCMYTEPGGSLLGKLRVEHVCIVSLSEPENSFSITATDVPTDLDVTKVLRLRI